MLTLSLCSCGASEAADVEQTAHHSCFSQKLVQEQLYKEPNGQSTPILALQLRYLMHAQKICQALFGSLSVPNVCMAFEKVHGIP